MYIPSPFLAAALLVAGFSTAVSAGLPGGVCSIEGQSCEMHDNVIMIMSGIDSLAQCRLLCEDEATCTAITHYPVDSFPSSETCILFSSCDTLNTCQNCTTEAGDCMPLEVVGLCSSQVEGQLGENLLQFLPDTENETDCRAACLMEPGCVFYTHHLLSDLVYPGACFLLSSLMEPILECENCWTGAADCSKPCWFLMDGKITAGGLLLIETFSPISVTPIALGTCELTLLAVGGGGSGGSGSSSSPYGGGGSGHVAWTKLNITGSSELEVLVGSEQEKSSIKNIMSEVLVEAQPGQNGGTSTGGSGYSGGGGSGSSSGDTHAGAGGTAGGNGEYGSYGGGGDGSLVKVDTIPMQGFTLSPGAGGMASSPYGGGGGGLLVDGKGGAGGNQHDGQGYGGGGSHTHDGKPGVVIISF